LTKVAGLLRNAFPTGKIDKAAKSECRIHCEPGRRLGRCVEAELQDVIYEDPRFFQIRVHIMQAVVDGLWCYRFDDVRNGAQNFLIHRQDLAICFFVGVIER